MVSCDLCYAISSYQCKLWIKEDFVKLKMIKKLNYENNVLATAYYQQIYMSNNKQLVAKFPYQIKFMQVLLEHALCPWLNLRLAMNWL